MSLKHTFTSLLADVPADATAGKTLPSHWNAEHTFPGAGAGEVVFVDASQHAATSEFFKFDAATKTLTVGAGGTGVVVGGSQLDLRSDADAGSALQLVADGSVSLISNLGGASVNITPGGGIDLANGPGLSLNIGAGTSGNSTFVGWYGGPFIPQDNNVFDIGGLAADLGSDRRIRTGYFGTSVVSPLYVAGSTAGLASFSGPVTNITVVGGIITAAS